MPAKIIVNGVTYDSVDAMPPDVRRLYEETLARLPNLMGQGDDGATRILQRGGLSIGTSHNEIRMSFQITGPGGFRKTFGAPSLPLPESLSTEIDDSRAPMKSVAIEPSSTESGIRTAILIGGCVILGLVLLAWFR